MGLFDGPIIPLALMAGATMMTGGAAAPALAAASTGAGAGLGAGAAAAGAGLGAGAAGAGLGAGLGAGSGATGALGLGSGSALGLGSTGATGMGAAAPTFQSGLMATEAASAAAPTLAQTAVGQGSTAGQAGLMDGIKSGYDTVKGFHDDAYQSITDGFNNTFGAELTPEQGKYAAKMTGMGGGGGAPPEQGPMVAELPEMPVMVGQPNLPEVAPIQQFNNGSGFKRVDIPEDPLQQYGLMG